MGLNLNEEKIKFLHELGYGVVIFDASQKIHLYSKIISKLLKLPTRFQDGSHLLEKLIPQHFFTHVFTGDNSVFNKGSIRNYRFWISPLDEAVEILFDVTAYSMGDDMVATVWQNIELDKLKDYGFIDDSIRKMVEMLPYIRPYVSSGVIELANTAVSHRGQNPFRSHVMDATILFSDIVGFTQKSEKMEPPAVVEMLNLVFSTIVHTIEKHFGYVDKFMGDAVMAVYNDPLMGVVSAIEILNEMASINELRALMNKDPIEVRIGVNTGKVIQGGIGMSHRMDWTVIGDVVNTASRIERTAEPGEALIGDATYQQVGEKVKISRTQSVSLKGKKEELLVHTVHSASFSFRGADVTIHVMKS